MCLDKTFERFLPGTQDQIALDAVGRFSRGSLSHVCLHGQQGNGKTHLLKAAHSFIGQTVTAKNVAFYGGEDLRRRWIRMNRPGQQPAYANFFHDVDMMIIAEAGFLFDPAAQIGIADLIQDLLGTLLTLDVPTLLELGELPEIGLDNGYDAARWIRSLPCHELHVPEADVRFKIVRDLAADDDVAISDTVCGIFAESRVPSVRALEHLFLRSVALAEVRNVAITPALAIEVLENSSIAFGSEP